MFPIHLRNLELIFKNFCKKFNSNSLSYFAYKVLNYKFAHAKTENTIIIQNKTYSTTNHCTEIICYEDDEHPVNIYLEMEKRRVECLNIADLIQVDDECDEFVYQELVNMYETIHKPTYTFSSIYNFDFNPIQTKFVLEYYDDDDDEFELDQMYYDDEPDDDDDNWLNTISLCDPMYYEFMICGSEWDISDDWPHYYWTYDDDTDDNNLLSLEEFADYCENNDDYYQDKFYEDFETVTPKIVTNESEIYSILTEIDFECIYDFARVNYLLELSFKSIQNTDLTTQIEFVDISTCESVTIQFDTFILLNKSQLARSYFIEFNSLLVLKIPEPCSQSVRTFFCKLLHSVHFEYHCLTADEFITLIKICEYLDIQF